MMKHNFLIEGLSKYLRTKNSTYRI